MKKLYLLIISFTLCFHLSAQENAAYAEIGGNGLGLSLNYERKITQNLNLFAHAGLGAYGITKTYLTVPVGFNYLFKLGKPVRFIDLGMGVTYTRADVKLYTLVDRKDEAAEIRPLNFIPSLGYRIHSRNMWMIRFSFTPVFNYYDGLPFAGVSIGKIF